MNCYKVIYKLHINPRDYWEKEIEFTELLISGDNVKQVIDKLDNMNFYYVSIECLGKLK